MEEILKNATYGEMFRTRQGNRALFLGGSPFAEGYLQFHIEGDATMRIYGKDGRYYHGSNSKIDIVGKWQEDV